MHRNRLGKSCRLKVAQRTVQDREFIQTLSKLGKSFCSSLDPTIIDNNSRERIFNASDNAEALNLIRAVGIDMS